MTACGSGRLRSSRGRCSGTACGSNEASACTDDRRDGDTSERVVVERGMATEAGRCKPDEEAEPSSGGRFADEGGGRGGVRSGDTIAN